MKKTGAELVRYALERIGARFTFGIPGVHTTEIYDQLASSPTITPIRVTAEGGGAFMADAVSRTNPFPGVLLIVPAAGTAMAYPGIGEAFLDGIPMLVISGGVRNDLPFRYQLHEIDQLEMVRPITKERWRIGEARRRCADNLRGVADRGERRTRPGFRRSAGEHSAISGRGRNLAGLRAARRPRICPIREKSTRRAASSKRRSIPVSSSAGARATPPNSPSSSPSGWTRRSRRPCRGSAYFPPPTRFTPGWAWGPPPRQRGQTPSPIVTRSSLSGRGSAKSPPAGSA